jgi:hypothetical protein
MNRVWRGIAIFVLSEGPTGFLGRPMIRCCTALTKK